MSVTLGWTPNPVLINLSLGESWAVSLVPQDSTTPAYANGTTITAQFYASTADVAAGNIITSWPATITGNTVTWNVPHAQTDLIPAGTLVRIRYSTPDGTGYLWASGSVVRND